MAAEAEVATAHPNLVDVLASFVLPQDDVIVSRPRRETSRSGRRSRAAFAWGRRGTLW
jgi:hypothetical protein